MKYNDNGQWKDINIKVSDTLPIGTVVPFAGERIPDGWLLCDGRAVSRTDYKELHNIIDDIYGEGDGTTTFNIPNMLGKTIVGYKQSDDDFNHLGHSAGEKAHTLTVAELPAHNHNLTGNIARSEAASGNNYNVDNQRFLVGRNKFANANVGTSSTDALMNYSNVSESIKLKLSNTGSGQAHNNLQPYIVQFYIIKAKQSIGIVGKVVDIKSDSNENTYSCDYINKKNEWKLIDKVVGNVTINLPEQFNELLAIIYPNNNVNALVTLNIPNGILETTTKGFNGGYQAIDTNAKCLARVFVTKTTAYINETSVQFNNNYVGNTSTLELYYR